MVVSVLCSVVLGGIQEKSMTFLEIEKAKYEAFTAYEGSGRYEVLTLPEALKQTISFTVGKAGRRIKVVTDEQPVVESGWTKDYKWLVNHLTQQYQEVKKPDGIILVDPYKPLVAEQGRASFAVKDMGPQFNADPVPTILKDEVVTESGKRLRRVEAVAKSEPTKGEIRIVQFFEPGSWITQRFSLEISASGKSVLRITGSLKDEKKGNMDRSLFSFPNSVIGRYQRVEG